ncbi:MAG: hypothetical protein BroJett033_7030 [Chloroflexota bacterium]|nr:MAG: hypothetical protein BroJett033_7030 [Chloroflexota bacterium]
MSTVYVATLGQRPEAITVAFDLLRERFHYGALAVLHTEPTASGIADAYAALRSACACDYPDLSVRFHEITRADGAPLFDISDQLAAEAYHRGVLEVLHDYRRDGWRVHLMLAGGRKAMSIYAMLAASLLFEPPRDRVWTVLSPEAMLAQPGQFHTPPGLRDQVQLVELPLRPARIAPGIGIEQLLAQSPSPAAAFLDKLSPAEREVADLLWRNPYASNKELAARGHKSVKTIETHLTSIYQKFDIYFDFGETVSDKRIALLDILRGG